MLDIIIFVTNDTTLSVPPAGASPSEWRAAKPYIPEVLPSDARQGTGRCADVDLPVCCCPAPASSVGPVFFD